MVPTRELYWNIHNHWLMYLLMIVAFAVFINGFLKRFRLWRLGQPIDRKNQLGERIKTILIYGLGHKRILKECYPGIMHFAIFWGFVILFIGTIIVGIQADFHLPLLYGDFYLGFSLVLDFLGVFAILGILMAIYRRYIVKPDRLDNKPDDLFSLVLILAILLSGFFLEGLRIVGTQDPWSNWSPVGKIFSMFFAGMSRESLIGWYQGLWWGHLILAFVFIAYLPYGKLIHIFTSLLSQFFRKLTPKGALPLIDFDDETRETFGINKLQDFSWKQLMDTDVCTRCGRCQDNCPAYLTKKPLSPKETIQSLKVYLKEEGPRLLAIKKNSIEGQLSEVAATVEAEKQLIGDVFAKDAVWSCTTCGSCEEQCPVFVEHIESTVELRRNLVLMESDFPQELQIVFRNLENNSNPWGVGWAERANWSKDLDLKNAAENSDFDYLYWVGCAGAFDDRNKKVAIAVSNLLKYAGVNFAILGTEEKCCGDTARRTGNEYLYQSLAQENIEILKSYNVTKIITSCPHCFNSLKNEYPQLGGNFEVIHHTEFLNQLIKRGKLKFGNGDYSIAYHDSCYLGRYNEIYQPPREALQAISNVKLLEMERNREKSFCCGAGGGRMWMEETIGTRINEKRTEEFLKTGANLVVTACPYCLTMFDDGIKAKGVENKQALDLSEVLLRALILENGGKYNENFSIGKGNF